MFVVCQTEAEVKRAKGGAAPDPTLDAKGLPPDYHFDPTWEVTPREVKSSRLYGEQPRYSSQPSAA